MPLSTHSVLVRASPRAVYALLTRFEGYPLFLEGVREVSLLDGWRMRWVVECDGRSAEWELEVVADEIDRGVAWAPANGAGWAGQFSLRAVDRERTHVHLQLELEPWDRGGSGAAARSLRCLRELVERTPPFERVEADEPVAIVAASRP